MCMVLPSDTSLHDGTATVLFVRGIKQSLFIIYVVIAYVSVNVYFFVLYVSVMSSIYNDSRHYHEVNDESVIL